MTVLLVALGAAVGAPARYLTDRFVTARRTGRIPYGTLVVNVAASFVLGVVTGAAEHISDGVAAIVGIGFCGALSTFSTFSWEVLQLSRHTRPAAIATVALNVFVTVGAAALGWWLAALA